MRTAVLLAAIASSAAVSSGAHAAPPTRTAGVLTAAIQLGNPGFAEGTMADPHGFSVDIARAVAARMGLKARLVNYPFPELFVPTAKPYDVAFEFATILPGRERFVDFSVPYLSSTQGVLVSKSVTGAVTLARLRTLQVCAKEATTGLAYVQNVLQPTGLVLQYASATGALAALSANICKAFVFDLPSLLAAKDAMPGRYGAVAGRVGSTERYGAVMSKGSPLRPAIDAAIASLTRDGTIRRIAARNFGPGLASAPPIR
jgi:polar amino acid transport system substrate-binding protein